MSSLVWLAVVFFLDPMGEGHFGSTKVTFTNEDSCKASVQMHLEELQDVAFKAWGVCIQLPGETA